MVKRWEPAFTMESYIFKTLRGELGYFQKENDDCKICIGSDAKSVKWSDWLEYQFSDPDWLPETTIKTAISQGISYFVWAKFRRYSYDIVELENSFLDAGCYYDRVNRDSRELFSDNCTAVNVIDEIRSFQLIMKLLTAIFDFIEPEQSNLLSYGHKLRELLNLACNEVEYLFLQILKSNGSQKSRYSTNDYVKILPFYKLEQYSVVLTMHPTLGKFSPFENWNVNNPTQSLSWYDAYNSVKHDRGGNFAKANLNSALNSVAAIHILLEAQYSTKLFDRLHSNFDSCFHTVKIPDWNCSELYAPLITDGLELKLTSKIACPF